MKKAQFVVDLKKEGLDVVNNLIIAHGLLSNKVLPFSLNKLAFANKKELKGWFSLLLSYIESLNKVFSINLVTLVLVTNFLRLKMHAFYLQWF